MREAILRLGAVLVLGAAVSRPVYAWSRYAFDFGSAEGSDVCAARAGTGVDLVRNRVPGVETGKFDGGNLVSIRHSDGTVASHAHLMTDKVLVKKGDWVDQGRKIALSCRTGNTWPPLLAHLHFPVMTYANTDNDYGSSISILLEEKKSSAWWLKAGESIASDELQSRNHRPLTMPPARRRVDERLVSAEIWSACTNA